MKKNVKLVSALLILVMVMAQVVCVSAATTPSVTYTSKQVDHYEKEFTFNVTNGADVYAMEVTQYDAKGNDVEWDHYDLSGSKTFGTTVRVRPTEIAKIKFVCYIAGGNNVVREVNVGGNSYYNPGSVSKPTEDYYTGLRGGSSSSSSNGTIVEGYYDPYNRYYEDKKEEIPEYEYYYVTCRKLNVRNGAGTWADKVGSLKRYDKVKVYDIKSNDWAVIEYAGHLRFVSAKYLAKK